MAKYTNNIEYNTMRTNEYEQRQKIKSNMEANKAYQNTKINKITGSKEK